MLFLCNFVSAPAPPPPPAPAPAPVPAPAPLLFSSGGPQYYVALLKLGRIPRPPRSQSQTTICNTETLRITPSKEQTEDNGTGAG